MTASSVYAFEHDSPPSYNEFMSKLSSESGFESSGSVISDESSLFNIDQSRRPSVTRNSSEFSGAHRAGGSPTHAHKTENAVNNLVDAPLVKFEDKKSMSLVNDTLNSKPILLGELPKDFLRIKLTTDQMKKIRSSIKKAKRSEITAILNNVSNKLVR